MATNLCCQHCGAIDAPNVNDVGECDTSLLTIFKDNVTVFCVNCCSTQIDLCVYCIGCNARLGPGWSHHKAVCLPPENIMFVKISKNTSNRKYPVIYFLCGSEDCGDEPQIASKIEKMLDPIFPLATVIKCKLTN